MRSRFVHARIWLALLIAAWVLFVRTPAVQAIGWGPTDFLISGAPNFPDRIGVFSQSFVFKGYLDQNFLGVQGMDFDANGNLVAVASLSTNPEVRVYSPSGTQIGGFLSNNPGLQFTGDLKVAPNGNYALGSFSNGVQVYSPGGTFVTQYGTGDSRGIAYLPGDRLWSGGAGTTVKVFDTISSAQVGTFSATGQTTSYSMQYNSTANTVLVVDNDRDLGGVYERDLTGALLREFHLAIAQTEIRSATRGPNGDVFGTTGDATMQVVRWNESGSIAGFFSVYPSNVHQVRILWAGNVPEPGFGITALSTCLYLLRPKRRI